MPDPRGLLPDHAVLPVKFIHQFGMPTMLPMEHPHFQWASFVRQNSLPMCVAKLLIKRRVATGKLTCLRSSSCRFKSIESVLSNFTQ